MEHEADCGFTQIELFDKCEYPPGGYIRDSIFLKTSQEYYQAIREWIFAQSLQPLQTPKFQFLDQESGQTQEWLEADDAMLGGESSMLNISEAPRETFCCPNEGEGYGLSQILLNPIVVPKKYYLSAKACQGILNRAEKRGKDLPPTLKKALQQQIESQTGGAAHSLKSEAD